MTEQLSLFGNWLPEKPNEKLSFHDWQIREGDVLYRCGVSQMSTTHLLAHLLRDQLLAERLLAHFGNLAAVSDASVVELRQIKGVGVSTAETIKVAFELSKRFLVRESVKKTQVYSPREIYLLLRDEMYGLQQEVLKALMLDTKNNITHIETVFVGALNCSFIHPREIFKVAIRQSAASVIICHNHPSGDPTPSKEDIQTTKEIVKAGDYIQIPVLDHVIIGDGYVSLKEEGML